MWTMFRPSYVGKSVPVPSVTAMFSWMVQDFCQKTHSHAKSLRPSALADAVMFIMAETYDVTSRLFIEQVFI